jgi:surfeit locus 1 family protein
VPGRRVKHLLPALLCALLILTGVLAGCWQLDRAAQKQSLQVTLDQGLGRAPIDIGDAPVNRKDVEYHRGRARGTWLGDRTVLIDNKVRGGVAGYHVVTPLKLVGSDMNLLVQRGWIAGFGDRREPAIRTPAGAVEVIGELRPAATRVFELPGAAPQGRVWQNLTLERYREASGLVLQPVMLLQTSEADDGLLRAWDRPDLGIDKHRGYAFQWFGLAIAAVIFFAVSTLRSRRRPRQP